MAKCTQCNGCFKHVWLEGKAYLYCPLCRLVYAKLPGGGFVPVEDPAIINAIIVMMGSFI